MIRLRFVETYGSLVSHVIRAAQMGLPYSHVEAITPDGKYLGAVMDGPEPGVQARDPSYDKGWTAQLIVELPVLGTVDQKFYDFLRSKIGLPYDTGALLAMTDGVLTGDPPPDVEPKAYICSALQTAALLAAGQIDAAPQSVRLATPRDVLVMCGALTKLPAPQKNPLARRLVY